MNAWMFGQKTSPCDRSSDEFPANEARLDAIHRGVANGW